MAKFSKKKSKRVTTRMRTKIERKVREHKRKVRKEQKKNPGKFKRKDPGVPNSHPMKHEILLAKITAEEQREKEREKKKLQRQKEREKLVAQKRRMDLGVVKNLEMVASEAEKKQKDFQEKHKKEAEEKSYSASSKPVESSVKTFYKEYKKVIDAADVVLEVLDARDPMGTRCAEVEQAVIASGSSKRLVLVLNKIDLVPQEIVKKWLKHLRNEFPTVAFKASTQSQSDHLSQKRIPEAGKMEYLLKSSSCLGADLLMKLLGNYCHQKDIKHSIRVGIVGFPNTGKSSIINSLKRRQVCNTGAVPGVTKQMQIVQLDKHISLLDSPGVVLAGNQSDVGAVLRNVVKLENLEDTTPAVEAILKRCNKNDMMLHYNIPSYKDVQEFLSLLARRYGKLRKGGVPDTNAAAKVVLKDWTSGKIAYYTHPPEQHTLPTHLSARIVQDLGQEFNVEDMDAADLVIMEGLKPNSSSFLAVESLGAVRGVVAEEDLQQMEEAQEQEELDQDMAASEEEEEEEDEEEDDDDEDLPEMEVVLPAKAGKGKAAAKPAARKLEKDAEVRRAVREMKNRKRGQEEPEVAGLAAASTSGANQQLGLQRKLAMKRLKKQQKRSDKISTQLSDALTNALDTAFQLEAKLDSDGDYKFSDHFDVN